MIEKIIEIYYEDIGEAKLEDANKETVLNLKTMRFEKRLKPYINLPRYIIPFDFLLHGMTGDRWRSTIDYGYHSMIKQHIDRLNAYRFNYTMIQKYMRKHELLYVGEGLKLYHYTDAREGVEINCFLLNKCGTGYKRIMLEDVLTYLQERRKNG